MDFGNVQFCSKHRVATPCYNYPAIKIPVVKLQANPSRVQEDIDDIDDNGFRHNKGLLPLL